MALLAVPLPDITAQTFEKPDPESWYRLTTRYNGSDQRTGRCIQYYPAGSEHPDMLWSAAPVDLSSPDYDYQLWTFIPSPDNPDRYKMVCKADPDGFVNPTPTVLSPEGRWEYVESGSASTVDPYGFLFVTHTDTSGVDSDGVSYCAIATDATIESSYPVMNCGAPRQNYAINLWSDHYSEDANEWLFRMESETDKPTSVSLPQAPAVTPVYYDLFGRPVAHPTAGLYICNGRKVYLRF